jgi:hypothetical protein
VVRPGNLTDLEKQACIGFFTGGDGKSTTFTDVDTFIPAAPGPYNIGVSFIPGAVGASGFQVNQIP